MCDQTDELTRELCELAASPAPGRGIDVARAVREGRVRLRRRRFAALGTVAAVAAATAAVSLLPAGGDLASRPAPAASRASAAPALDPDPLVAEASYGWLPANFDDVTYMTDKVRTFVRAAGKVPDGGAQGPIVWLRVYPAGTTPSTGLPWYSGGPRQYRVEAPPVEGRPAYWVGKSPTAASAPGGDWYLRWQTADGRWVELQASYLAGTDAQQILHRIAEGVVVARRAIPLPYRISGVPAGLRLNDASFVQGQPMVQGEHVPWSSSINFLVDGMYIGTTIEPDRPESVKSSANANSKNVRTRPTCIREHGLKLCTESLYGVDAYRTVGGPKAWLKRFTLLGTNQRDWTTNVQG
ncbi:hypothetical protein ACIQFZ_03975 [Streptomyces sp. NPDC093064]|uniref:hypothetical protein n=1 Tax=Streptomyces sp. NPDC093064 TaxID=3366020 RepID=UPI003803B52C